MNQDKWIYTDKRSGNLVLRFRVKGYEKQFFIGTGLADTSKNRKIVRARRDLISSDITLERFDSTLESYRSTPDRRNITPKAQIRKDSPSYNYDLAELWEKFTEFKRALLEQTTIISRYRSVSRYISRLPTKSLEKASVIRDWLLANTTHYMAWENLNFFYQCCGWAVDSGLIPINPFAKLQIKQPKKRSDSDDEYAAFTLEQRDLIIEAFEKHNRYSHYAPLIKFLFWTGSRPGEAFALTWADVQENATRIRINKAYAYRISKGTKNGKKRVFPTLDGSRLHSMLLEIKPPLGEYNPHDLVFKTKTGRQLHKQILTSIWNETTQGGNGKVYRYSGVVRELAAKELVPYLKPYATRHTFATWAIASGVSPALVALWIGDEVETVLKFYCHPEVVSSECPDF